VDYYGGDPFFHQQLEELSNANNLQASRTRGSIV
jgi:hypothetical protein